MTVSAFEAYQNYHALKLHFTTKSYDYFKYNGKTKVSYPAFKRSNLEYTFKHLGAHSDLTHFIVANLIDRDPDLWAKDLLTGSEADDSYNKWLKRDQSLTYCFKSDLDLLDPQKDYFTCKNGKPALYEMYLAGEVSIDTMVMINSLIKYMSKWSKWLAVDPLWQREELKLTKYEPFRKFDRAKIKDMLIKKFL